MEKKVLVFVVILGLARVGFIGCTNSKTEATSAQTINSEVYQCPMGCDSGKTYDKSGDCPMCGMEMEKK